MYISVHISRLKKKKLNEEGFPRVLYSSLSHIIRPAIWHKIQRVALGNTLRNFLLSLQEL